MVNTAYGAVTSVMYVIVDFSSLYFSLLVAPTWGSRVMLPCWCVALCCSSPGEQPSQEIKMPLQHSESLQKTSKQTLIAHLWTTKNGPQNTIYYMFPTCRDRVSQSQTTGDKHLNPALLFLRYDRLPTERRSPATSQIQDTAILPVMTFKIKCCHVLHITYVIQSVTFIIV